MAFPLPVTAAQVGTYFVGQYYQMLQNQPDFVYQFYNDASTMLRVDENLRETASAMLQIHQLIMSLNYMGIEIKTAHSLESWNRGVLVVVSGSVFVKDFTGRKKFVETFFLAPQEKGYVVLNDIFHYVDEEKMMQQNPFAYLPQTNLDSQINSSAIVREKASNYNLGGDFRSRDFSAPVKIEENGQLNNSKYLDEPLHQVPESEHITEDNFAVQSNGGTMNSSVTGHFSPLIEEEPTKHTYASIVAKVQSSSPLIPVHSSFNKTATPTSESQHITDPTTQPPVASSTPEDSSFIEDEVEIMSVYVSNVPTTMSASEIGEEFKKFGKLKPDGVAIRTRKDIDLCYAFVEFEDISGVQNAIKASAVQIGGHELYIEERRPNRNNFIRGGRGRGRGRFSYPMDGTRGGRIGGRSFGRGSYQDGIDLDYNRQRGNGFYRQERAYSTFQ